MEPIVFNPIYMTRVWGGRTLETKFNRALPDDQPYGESWEISDRIEEQSTIAEGHHAGKTLHDLWTNERDEIFGPNLVGDRFPLLIKILDARDDLSIQVHPPKEVAGELGGDPKTEMWYIADCDPQSSLYVGLKNGVSAQKFESAISDGSVADQVHALHPQPGESIFIPSGRLHAIGAGFLIYEIQQNSDTTYRVFDWNRTGLDGSPRDLHVTQSLKSIDFNDFEPSMDMPDGNIIAQCEHFVVEKIGISHSDSIASVPDRFSIFTIVSGSLQSSGGRTFLPGEFFLLPKNGTPLTAPEDAIVLRTTIPV